MVLVYLIFLLYSPNTLAMRTQEVKRGTEFSIVLSDGIIKEPTKNLTDCPVAIEQRELHKQVNADLTLALPSFTQDDWRDFSNALKENADEVRERLSDKKRARAILNIADFMGHELLLDISATEWAQNEFSCDDCNPNLEPLLAQKIIATTPLLKKLSSYMAPITQLDSVHKNLAAISWSCCSNPVLPLIAAGGNDGILTIVSSNGGVLTRNVAHASSISDLQCTADGSSLFSVAMDGTIKQWNMLAQPITLTKQFVASPGYPFNVHVHTQGHLIACDDINCIRLLDVISGDVHMRLDTGRFVHNGLKFNINGTLIVAGNAAKEMRVFNVASGECVHVQPLGHSSSCHFQFSPDKNILGVGCKNGAFHLFDSTTFKHIKTFKEHTNYIWGIEFIPGTQFVVTGCADKKIKIWDIDTQKCITTKLIPQKLNDMRLITNNVLIVVSDSSSMRVIDLKPFLNNYTTVKNFLQKKLTLEQAQLIKKAYTIHKINFDDEKEPIYIGQEPEKTIFNSLPINLQTALLRKLPESIVRRKKRKSHKQMDEDYVVSDQSE